MTTAAAPPPGPVNQPLLFQWLRWHQLRNSWRRLFGHSLVRPITILLCTIVVWVFVFAFSWGGFYFLKVDVGLPPGGDIVGLLLDLLFLVLAVLLIFSTGLILYASLFASPETAFLLSKPVAADQVFAYKFQGAVAFSSWAFLLLGGPVLIAHGLVCDSPWYFYAFLPLFFLGFVLLPGSASAIITLLLVNYVPRRRKQAALVLVALLLVGIGAWVYSVVQQAREGEVWNREAVTGLLGRFTFARGVMVPSHWVARGLRLAGRGDLGGTLYHLALVWSNGLFLYLITAVLARRLYRRGYNRLATGGTLRRRYGGAWMDRLLGAVLPFVHPGTRLLIVKDFRTFRRDPQQWAQILIFCGLMVLYFANIRNFFAGDIAWTYQNSISLLNLVAVSLLLCTYTGRFVYPLLSLEGRKFWVLGLLPLKREQLLWGKFAFATTGGLVLAAPLVLLSDLMLDMPWDAVVLHLVAVTILATGLCGLSVGLGACMPNFRETDPSKIAVGFGGTLNLVAELLFLLAVLMLTTLPWHVQRAMLGSAEEPFSPAGQALLAAGLTAGLGVGLAAVTIPLHAGIRALRRMEF